MSSILTNFLLSLTDFGRFINKSLAGIGLINSGNTWIIIFFIIFVVLLVGFTSGRTKLLIALLSVYAAAFVESVFPYSRELEVFIKNLPEYWIHFGLFLFFYLVIFWALNRSFLKSRLLTKEMSIIWIFIFSFLEIGLVASIFFSYVDNQKTIFPVSFAQIFGTKTGRFIWGILPIVFTFFLKGKRDSSRLN